MIRDAFGIIYEEDQSMQFRELVFMRTVGALPVGGRYRSIDFILSNMVNSGIRNVGVVTHRNYHSLMDHLGSGKEWDLSRKNEGLYILPPYANPENPYTYHGVVDGLKNASGYIARSKQKYCILSGSYTIYNMAFDDMVEYHVDSGADITMLYNEVPRIWYSDENKNDVRLHLNEDNRVIDLELGSGISDSQKMGMDTYVIRKDLLEYLVEDCIAHGYCHLVSDLLMKNIDRIKIVGYRHDGYVGRLYSATSYYRVNMDMLEFGVNKDLFYSPNQIYTKIKDEVPAKYTNTAHVKNSLIANGCTIEGEVENSILFRTVYVGKGAKIKNCIIMQDSEIYNNTDLENVIVDKGVNIRQGRRLIGDKEFPVIIRKGAIV
ncbi:MAG: glucose-1-phosphate adenylyltransferase subunit GlgD [Christensenellaceae bacterium]|jgi:glucose-1-phosphate adenylyltransferase